MSQLVQALQKDVGGTLTFASSDGIPSAPSVVLYDAKGDEVATGTPSIAGSALSFVVAGNLCDETADVYRARWAYTAGGVARVRDMTWAVKTRIAYHQLTTARLVAEYFPILGSRYPAGVSSWDAAIAGAWAEYQGWVRSRGLDPHRVIDTAPVEPIVAELAASRAAVSYSYGGAQTDSWQQWAADRRRAASEAFARLVAAVGWYDAVDDLTPTMDEVATNRGTLRLSR